MLQHAACNRCRLKKVYLLSLLVRYSKSYDTQLRCSGQKNGCDRYKATSSVCEYNQNAEAKEQRKRRRGEKQESMSEKSSAISGQLSSSSRHTTSDSGSPQPPGQDLLESNQTLNSLDSNQLIHGTSGTPNASSWPMSIQSIEDLLQTSDLESPDGMKDSSLICCETHTGFTTAAPAHSTSESTS